MSAEYIFDRYKLCVDDSIDLHDYLTVREILNARTKEKVVRCKDCVSFDGKFCKLWGGLRKETAFCSDGEQRED